MSGITYKAWARAPRPSRAAEAGWSQSEYGIWLPSAAQAPIAEPRPLAVDLFAGAGGMSLGLHEAGYHVIGAVEIDNDAAITYLVNLARHGECSLHFESSKREKQFSAAIDRMNANERTESALIANAHCAGSGYIANEPEMASCEHLWIWDARTLTGKQMLEDLELEPGALSVVAAGPPCQGFSVAGKRNVMDPRNTLVFEAARLITELAPAAFIMENVPGMQSMTTAQGTSVLDTLAATFSANGWGSMKALRQALDTNENARAVVRPAKRAAKTNNADSAQEPEVQQAELF